MSSTGAIFQEIEKRLTKEKAEKINASFLFQIGGEQGEQWFVDLTKPSNWVQKAESPTTAQCTITIHNPEDWASLAAGKMNPAMAFMQGKIKVKGNMSLALKLQNLLS